MFCPIFNKGNFVKCTIQCKFTEPFAYLPKYLRILTFPRISILAAFLLGEWLNRIAKIFTEMSFARFVQSKFAKI